MTVDKRTSYVNFGVKLIELFNLRRKEVKAFENCDGSVLLRSVRKKPRSQPKFNNSDKAINELYRGEERH
jgi:hypothetical protein